MAKKSAQTASWLITLDGAAHPLRLTLEAVSSIELLTGRTLYQHAEAAAARAVTLRDLAIILRCLLGPGCRVEELRGPAWAHFGTPIATMEPEALGNGYAEAAILRTGIVDVLAIVMTPIVHGLQGGVTADGDAKPGFSLKR